MFWNKVHIIFIICCYLTVSQGADTTTADERIRICTGIALGKYTFHPYDLKKYIECTANPIERTCVTNSCFDRVANQCKVDACPKALTSMEMNYLCSSPETKPISYPGNNTQFIFCLHQEALPRECGAKECFDATTGCNNEACFQLPNSNINNDIATIRTECAKLDWLYVLADKYNCEYYYTCLGKDADPVYMQCPANLHFSKQHHKCAQPIEANCQFYTEWCKNKQNGIKFSAQNCYEYYECQDEVAKAKSCSYDEHFDVDQAKCLKGMCLNRDGTARAPTCTARDEGIYKAHPQCNKYYICLKNTAVERQCLTGNHFDARLRTCVRDTKNICK